MLHHLLFSPSSLFFLLFFLPETQIFTERYPAKPLCPQRSVICRVMPPYDWSSFCCFSYFIVWLSPGPELRCIETSQAFTSGAWEITTPATLWGCIWLGKKTCEGVAGLSSHGGSCSWHVRQLLAAPLVHGLYTDELACWPKHPPTIRLRCERDCRSQAQGSGSETQNPGGQSPCVSLAFYSWALTNKKKNMN